LVRILLSVHEMLMAAEQFDDVFSFESDDELVERARRGSGAAFAELVARHREAVYLIARNMSATLRETETVLKQAFLAAWRELRFFPAGERFTTWLYGIAMETALAQRRRDRGSSSSSLEQFLPAFDRAGRLVETDGRWPEFDGRSSGRTEIPGLLRQALECVDDQTRAVFVLSDLLQLPVDEAAAVLRTSPSVVRRDAHRARLMLRGFIDQL
jgi:RNA polymerase sigma-70 factor (ECF subfamily)